MSSTPNSRDTYFSARDSSVMRKSVVLAVVGTAFLIVMMDYSIMNVALQTIQKSFDASNSQLQWMVSAYEIPYAALLLPAGFLADRYGRKRILLAGLALFVIASGCIATSTTPNEIVAWRGLMGIGGSVVPATTLAIIKDVFPPAERVKAMGVWSALGGASVAVGPILGGALVQWASWWTAFLINVPIVTGCALLSWRMVPESREPVRSRLDWPGVLLTIAGVGAVTFGLIKGGETNVWLTPGALGMISIGMVLIVTLILVETRRRAPLLDLSLLRNRPFASGTMCISLAFFALSGGTYLLVFYMQLIRGATPLALGLAMLPVAVGAIGGSLASDAVLSRVGPRVTITIGTLLLVAGFAGFANSDASPLGVIECYFLLAGTGMGLTMGSTTPLTMTSIPADKAGSGAGATNMIRGVTSIVGVSALGSIYSLVYRERITVPLAALSQRFPRGMNESLSQTLIALKNMKFTSSYLSARITGIADSAFVGSFQTCMWVAVVVLSVGCLVGLFWLPRTLSPHREENNHPSG